MIHCKWLTVCIVLFFCICLSLLLMWLCGHDCADLQGYQPHHLILCGWLQCLSHGLWSDWLRQNLHNDGAWQQSWHQYQVSPEKASFLGGGGRKREWLSEGGRERESVFAWMMHSLCVCVWERLYVCVCVCVGGGFMVVCVSICVDLFAQCKIGTG